MNSLFYDPFTHPIGIFQNDDMELNSKIKKLLEEKNKDSNLTEEWHDNIFELDYPEIKELERIFKRNIRSYQVQDPRTLLKFTIKGWANIRKGNSDHSMHSHPQTDLICNYYVSTPEGSRLDILNPSQSALQYEWTMGKNTLHTIDVKEGMMIIMPSWYLHQVPPTYSEDNRISVSCNVRLNND